MTLEQRRHIHVAGTMVGQDIDKCAACGLDLRDPIHLRVIPGAIVRTQPENYDALQAAIENPPEPTDKQRETAWLVEALWKIDQALCAGDIISAIAITRSAGAKASGIKTATEPGAKVKRSTHG